MSGSLRATVPEPTLPREDRAVTPAVGKALEATVVVLFVGLLTTTLFGGVVPDYRTATGDEVADRTVAAAAHRVQDALPPDATAARASARVDLPDTIRGEGYAIRADGRDLVLDHPHRGVGGRATLPGRVVRVTGEWYSRRPATVVVEGTGGGLAVRLREGSRPAVDSRTLATGDPASRSSPGIRGGGPA